jgi:hypothetical protein
MNLTMNRLLILSFWIAAVSGGIGYVAGHHFTLKGIASTQLEIMQTQQVEADAAKAKEKKLIDDFTKSLKN